MIIISGHDNDVWIIRPSDLRRKRTHFWHSKIKNCKERIEISFAMLDQLIWKAFNHQLQLQHMLGRLHQFLNRDKSYHNQNKQLLFRWSHKNALPLKTASAGPVMYIWLFSLHSISNGPPGRSTVHFCKHAVLDIIFTSWILTTSLLIFEFQQKINILLLHPST